MRSDADEAFGAALSCSNTLYAHAVCTLYVAVDVVQTLGMFMRTQWDQAAVHTLATDHGSLVCKAVSQSSCHLIVQRLGIGCVSHYSRQAVQAYNAAIQLLNPLLPLWAASAAGAALQGAIILMLGTCLLLPKGTDVEPDDVVLHQV